MHILNHHLVVQGTEGLVILLQHLNHLLVLENRRQRLVLSLKAQADHAIPLLLSIPLLTPYNEVHGWRRVVRLDAAHARLYLGRGIEVVPPHLQQLLRSRQQLRVHRQAAIQIVSRSTPEHSGKRLLGTQSLRELLLEHEHGSAEEGTVLEQLKHNARRNDVGDVCNAQIEVRKLHLQEVAMNNLQVGRIFPTHYLKTEYSRSLHLLLHFIDHARIQLHGNHLLGLLEQLHRENTVTGTDFQNDIRGLDPRLRHDVLHHSNVLDEVLTQTTCRSRWRRSRRHARLADRPFLRHRVRINLA